MHMPEFSLSKMPLSDAQIYHSDFLKKRFLKLTMDHIVKHGIVGETAGGTPKKLISYSGLVNSRKSMVKANLAQNVQNTKNV